MSRTSLTEAVLPSRDGELLGLLFLGGDGIEFLVVGWPRAGLMGARKVDAAFDSRD
jgi:hypothetical protein